MASLVSYLGWGAVAFVLVIAFVLGAVMASFITCVAYRLMAGESPWKGRSHCDTCGHTLGALDLVPILGWVARGGKCHYCGARIPVRCVVTEVLLGIVFALIVWVFGLGIPALAYCALATVLLGVSLYDLDTMTIPNGFIIALIAIWTICLALCGVCQLAGVPIGLYSQQFAASQLATFGAMGPWVGTGALSLAMEGLIGAVVLCAIIFVVCLVFEKITGKVGLGGGDIKLLFACTLYLGFALGLFNLVVSCILGIVFFVVGLAKAAPATDDADADAEADAQADAEALETAAADAAAAADDAADDAAPTPAKGAFPFGPAIAVATIISLFGGIPFVVWYLSLVLGAF